MPICSACGRESPEGFGFCPACGAPLLEPEPERRKLATLLFCDVSGSTALGERVDAESVRELMFRYFHEMRDAIERHGGTVEKFVGDAVMAVFGVPVSHEDDALRAVRAAAEMQDRVVGLNDELVRRVGSTIALRIGVHTGEVVAGDASSRETFVTGDAVNTAARLEQAASPGEVLIGEPTFRLVRDAVDTEAVTPLKAKGKAEPVAAYRLLAVRSLAPGRARRFGGLLVGRREELAVLRSAFVDAASGSCRLVSVIGEAGVGKSRLVRELMQTADAIVLEGRCLPYGEGITYWPLAEIVRSAAEIHDETSGDAARARLRELAPEPAVASPLELVLGLGEGTASPETIAWATRRVLERLAETRPAVVVIDDLHWAEDALLDLVEDVALRGAGRILLVALARPELLERRPWPGTILRLASLSTADVEALAAELGVPDEQRSRVCEASGGNPLFVEELASMVADDPAAATPATLEELLAARLDRLDRPEREAAERGSVEGQVFHRGAVATLSRSTDQVRAAIDGLLEREVVVPAEASFADDAAFRFRHLLIRDAAYRGIAKRVRAELHERFADWLVGKAGGRLAEVEEIVGYHLEHAVGLLGELGPVDRVDLSDRASRHLAASGKRALDRGDLVAGANLLHRAANLTNDRHEEASHSVELGIVMTKLGRFEEAESILAHVREGSADERFAVSAGVELAFLRSIHNAATVTELYEVASTAARRLGELEAPLDRGRALTRACVAQIWGQRLAVAARTGREALAVIQQTGRRREESEILEWMSMNQAYGPDPIEADDPVVRQLVARSADDRSLEWLRLIFFAVWSGYRGEFEEARALIRRSMAITDELGLRLNHACTSMQLTLVELLGGDLESAERELRSGYDELVRLGAANQRVSVAAHLALVLACRGGREEVFAYADDAENAPPDDVEPRVTAGAARTRALATVGRLEEAEEAGRATLARWEGSDNVFLGAQSLAALAHVLKLRGNSADARAVLDRELAMHERKQNLPGAARARRELASLGL